MLQIAVRLIGPSIDWAIPVFPRHSADARHVMTQADRVEGREDQIEMERSLAVSRQASDRHIAISGCVLDSQCAAQQYCVGLDLTILLTKFHSLPVSVFHVALPNNFASTASADLHKLKSILDARRAKGSC